MQWSSWAVPSQQVRPLEVQDADTPDTTDHLALIVEQVHVDLTRTQTAPTALDLTRTQTVSYTGPRALPTCARASP